VLDEKETTVYKRALETQYNLKMKASRAVFTEINNHFPTMPFTLRALLETSQASKDSLKPSELRLGMIECVNHGLLHPYPVLHEKVRLLPKPARDCALETCLAHNTHLGLQSV
jgi:hypothetical protein